MIPYLELEHARPASGPLGETQTGIAMSFYAQIEGSIRFKDNKALEEAVKSLQEGGWLNDECVWMSEMGSPTSDECAASPGGRELTIPRNFYRNLTRALGEIARGTEHSVKWASSDGCFAGGVLGGKEVDLDEWAKESGFDPAPVESDFADEGEYQDALSNWQDDVMDAFLSG